MADKVQMKTQACETSLFHHGLVKLIVLHELQKVNREWSAFLFLSGIGVEGTGASPQVKETSSSKTTEPAETKSRRFVKLKPRKQVKEPMINTSLNIQRTPQSAQKKRTHVKETILEQSTSKTTQKKLTRSQRSKEKGKAVVTDENLELRGDLNDILQAIDIEESPLVQAEFIKMDTSDKSKKLKTSKKLDFEDEVSEFVFKPTKPLTRHSKKIQ